jgi:hypothetical protein
VGEGSLERAYKQPLRSSPKFRRVPRSSLPAHNSQPTPKIVHIGDASSTWRLLSSPPDIGDRPEDWGRGRDTRPIDAGHRDGAGRASGATGYRYGGAQPVVALAKVGGSKVKTRRLTVLAIGMAVAALTAALARTRSLAKRGGGM